MSPPAADLPPRSRLLLDDEDDCEEEGAPAFQLPESPRIKGFLPKTHSQPTDTHLDPEERRLLAGVAPFPSSSSGEDPASHWKNIVISFIIDVLVVIFFLFTLKSTLCTIRFLLLKL